MVFLFELLILAGVRVDHLHGQPVDGFSGYGFSDSAQSNDSQRSARDGLTEKELGSPDLELSGSNIGVRFHNPPGSGHHEGQRMFRHSLGQHTGRMGDHDSIPGGRRDIDVVVSDRIIRHNFEIRIRGEKISVHLIG